MMRSRRHPLPLALLAGAALFYTEGAAHAGIGDLKGTKPGELNFPQFADADTCSSCHGGGVNKDKTFLPFDTWAGTMMGNAARDPVFFAALTIANQDKPGVGTYCLRCHSPIGFVREHATPPDGSAFDNVDRQGVGCDTCHRAIQSPAPNNPYLLSDAQLVYVESPAKHGPYENEDSPAHADSVQDTGLSDSRFCGQCHQVTNPDVLLKDAAGKDTSFEFPLDTTYEEWASSDYGKADNAAFQSCIDCHMPKKLGQHPVTKIPDGTLRTDPRIHTIVGGNHWGIQAVMAANPKRVEEYKSAFDLALQGTLDNLAKAVKVTVMDAPTSGTPGGPLQVTVRVENLTGHKFPTGYAESRRAWIGVSLVDAQKQERALLGGYDPATGAIQATPATRVYRAQHGKWDGQKGLPEEHLALHDMVISDTRIPPRGFIASETTSPSGEIDFSDGKDGYKSFDEATFTLTAPADAADDLTLSVRVYYQSMTHEHIEFLKTANTTDSRGEELEKIFKATGEGAPLLIASAESTVSFPKAPSASANSSSGAGGSGGSSGDAGDCGCRAVGAPLSSLGATLGWLAVTMALAHRTHRTHRTHRRGRTARRKMGS
jgi:hypothetical protein